MFARFLSCCTLAACLSGLSAVDLDGLNVSIEGGAEGEGGEGAAAGERVDPQLARNLAVVWDYDKGEAYYIDELGTKLAGPFQDAYGYKEGLGLAQASNNLYYLFDGKGKQAVEPPQWGFFRSVYSEGLVVVEGAPEGGANKFFYFDRAGNQVLGPFEEARPFEGGFAQARTGSTWGIINRKGKTVATGRPVEQFFGDEVAAVRMSAGGAWYFIDTEGQRVCGSTWQSAGAFNQGWAPVLYDPAEGEWAFIDKYGDLMDKRARYTEAKAFRDGVAPVRGKGKKDKPGKWGLIDLAGKKVCSYKYDDMREMHDGLAAFYDGDSGLWGFIDRGGKIAIKPRFGGVFDFTNGIALVSEGNRDFYINRNGEQVWPKAGK